MQLLFDELYSFKILGRKLKKEREENAELI
jgi:hypothetical protein